MISNTENKLNGIVKVEETYKGGKGSNKHNSKKQNLGCGIIVKGSHINDTKPTALEKFVKENVTITSIVFTDEHKRHA